MKLKKMLAFTSAALLLAVCGTGCGNDTGVSYDPAATPETLTDLQFIVTLYPKVAPITVTNFETLVTEGFYDGLTFHRVVDDFMAQGGDPLGTGSGGSDQTIKGEFSANGVKNDLSHTRGVISMARNGFNMDSASSQFFICYRDCSSFLDGQYAAFGEVTEGMEVVDSFLQIERSVGGDGAVSSPNTPIVIDSAVMIESDGSGNPRVLFTMQDFLAAQEAAKAAEATAPAQ